MTISGKRLLNIITGKNDTAKLRSYFKEQGIHPELWMEGNRKPKAPYVIHDEGKKRVMNWLRGIKPPSTFGLQPAKMFFAFDPGKLCERNVSLLYLNMETTQQ